MKMAEHITKKKVEFTVKMQVTVPQALALQAMFRYWNELGSMGSSRDVAFRVDGDGNFHPKCEVSTSEEIPELTNELADKANTFEIDGNRLYDFDSIAWHFTDY